MFLSSKNFFLALLYYFDNFVYGEPELLGGGVYLGMYQLMNKKRLSRKVLQTVTMSLLRTIIAPKSCALDTF